MAQRSFFFVVFMACNILVKGQLPQTTTSGPDFTLPPIPISPDCAALKPKCIGDVPFVVGESIWFVGRIYVNPSAPPASPPTAPAPPTGAPPTGAPPTGVPPTGTPPTGAPPTGTPPTGVPPTGTPPTGTPPTGVPPTGAPPTGTPPTGTPPTGVPPTGAPPTETPPTGAPPTGTPPTGTPPTGVPPTGTPPTGAPPTETPPTGTPPTGTPPTGTPPTGVPPTGTPPTGAPPTGTPPTGTPPIGTPPTGVPPTGTPPTGAPPTGTPPTGTPPTGAPPTGAPPTGAPPTNTPPCNTDNKCSIFSYTEDCDGIKVLVALNDDGSICLKQAAFNKKTNSLALFKSVILPASQEKAIFKSRFGYYGFADKDGQMTISQSTPQDIQTFQNTELVLLAAADGGEWLLYSTCNKSVVFVLYSEQVVHDRKVRSFNEAIDKHLGDIQITPEQLGVVKTEIPIKIEAYIQPIPLASDGAPPAGTPP